MGGVRKLGGGEVGWSAMVGEVVRLGGVRWLVKW